MDLELAVIVVVAVVVLVLIEATVGSLFSAAAKAVGFSGGSEDGEGVYLPTYRTIVGLVWVAPPVAVLLLELFRGTFSGHLTIALVSVALVSGLAITVLNVLCVKIRGVRRTLIDESVEGWRGKLVTSSAVYLLLPASILLLMWLSDLMY